MSSLNAQQKLAVQTISAPCLVLAGAGSGKTSVITEKIAYLIKTCGLQAKHIAAVTFTNKAAKEMKERVQKLLDKPQSRGLTVATFHNLGLNLLKKEGHLLKLRPGFSIFDAEDAKALIKELTLQSGDLDLDLLDIIQQTIAQLKNDFILPNEAILAASQPQEMRIAQIYLQYVEALSAYNAVDFDDLITLPVQLFRKFPEILLKWQQKIRYLLVDEYQDTNNAQYELVRCLVGDSTGLTVVGDDDQSIYAWRGAKPENLASLQKDFIGLKLIKLEQNYRSTRIILDSANHLIANNPHTFEKKLWSDLGYGSPIRLIAMATDKAEATRVANEIIAYRLRLQNRYSDYAILYRSNHQARVMELALREENLPYRINGGISFFSRTEVKDIFAYLRLLTNPNDDNAFLRIINVPRRKLGTSTLEKLGQCASQLGLSLFDSIDHPELANYVPKSAQDNLLQFYHWVQNILQKLAIFNPIQVIEEMVDEIDYEQWLLANSQSPQIAQRRMENVRFLIENVKSAYQYEQEESDHATIQDAVSRLILRDLLERQSEEDEADDQIQLLTMHAAKGLEYHTVFIIGVEEEILPHRNSIEAGNIEEERRLAYVALTRARQQLIMSYANKRKQFGEIIETTPSRFIDELPKDHLQREGLSQTEQSLNLKQGKETLSGLKQLLDDF